MLGELHERCELLEGGGEEIGKYLFLNFFMFV